MGIQMWNAIIRGGERKEMGIQLSITKRTHSWGKMYLFILFILWYDTNQEEGIFMRLPVSWSTHVYMMCVCVCVCGENLPVFFCCWYFLIFFRLHWNPGNIPWQEHISGVFGHYGIYDFFIHVCIPVQIYLYSCIFQWLLLKTSFVEMHTCFFWTDVQVYTSPLACVSVILSHARNIHSVPDFSDCKREYFTLPSFKTQNVYRCVYSLSNTVVMFCQM